ncbi:MAG: hypothetical protein JRJ42_04835 [Deltaproteobacteria bacterium]|nr:hypothetical protein [Deltaproteobacteria bacterium]MBW2073776.1 hypothetical protein [Deltaproteobacteria bacterium]
MEQVHTEQMEQEHKEQIEEIIGHMECPKDFKCYKSGLKVLCAAKDIGTDICLECLEESPQDCKFSLSTGDSYLFGDSYLCACPVRIYICKKLNR